MGLLAGFQQAGKSYDQAWVLERPPGSSMKEGLLRTLRRKAASESQSGERWEGLEKYTVKRGDKDAGRLISEN